MSTRVHELAKELGIPSKDLVERLNRLKIPVKGHMSVVDEEIVAKIRHAVARVKPAAAKTVAKSAAATSVATKPEAKARVATAAAPPKAVPAVKTAAAPVTTKTAAKPRTAVTAAPEAPSAPAAPPPAPAAPKSAPAPAAPTAAPEPPPAAAPAPALKSLQLTCPISVKDLAEKIEVKPNELIKLLITRRVFASLTHQLAHDVVAEIVTSFGYELAPEPTPEERLQEELAPDPAKLVARAPVVTFMGHVDHGKTSLLDAVRQSKVAEGEAGGITQHIGAYEVVLPKGRVTFLDTPGHEAFTALRARGANVTDIVVLVVAADDGVMPQTVEAIDHAKAAGVPIIVAINKIDKPDANPQKVKQQLTEHGLLGEDWGGKTIMVPVSARTRQGLDTLLEMFLLEAELLELKADPTCPAQGIVIEAKLTKDRGPLATLLVQQGTLRVGDLVVVGTLGGRVRAMINDRGHRIKDAPPATPVEVLGLPGVPNAGDRLIVVADEKRARSIVERRQEQASQRLVAPPKRITLDDLHQRITKGQLKELKLILKGDVQGSIEAISASLSKLQAPDVTLNTIHAGVGDISESDVMLAAASDAVVIGFHVGIEPQVQVIAVQEGVDVRIFKIIYEVVNEIKAGMEGLLEPKLEETFLGRAEVRRLFQVSKIGIVCGCMVTKGIIRRDALVRVIRGKERLTETKIGGLKRLKDDVREVGEGLECGISLEGNTDIQAGDFLEAWDVKKVARKLA